MPTNPYKCIYFAKEWLHGAQTCLCTHDERVTVWVKHLCQFNCQVEGLASSQHKLIQGNLTCAVFNIVGSGLEVHFHQAWTTTRCEQIPSLQILTVSVSAQLSFHHSVGSHIGVYQLLSAGGGKMLFLILTFLKKLSLSIVHGQKKKEMQDTDHKYQCVSSIVTTSTMANWSIYAFLKVYTYTVNTVVYF